MNPNLVGLYAGAIAAAGFFAFCFFRHKKVPTLNQVAVVLLACAGAVVGFHLGYLSLAAEDTDLGKLADQRIAVFLGALAVVWTAAESIVMSIRTVKASKNSSSDLQGRDPAQ